jgi:DNA-binding response OmpR family regulator
MKKSILIVEDDEDISRLLELHLKDGGYDTETALDGSTGLRLATSNNYDLVMLDIMLPGPDGIDIMKHLREQDQYTPIMLITSKTSELDRVLGLELGADDYVTKPFSVREILARVKAIFRRVEALDSSQALNDGGKVVAGGLSIDLKRHIVTLDEQPVALTAKEFDLLAHFALHPGHVQTRAQLLDAVWGYGYEGYEHTVNSNINRLRAKIEADPAHPHFILTVRGVGYKFTEEP